MQPFDYVIPRDHAEASALLSAGDQVRAFMGGTDLLVRIRGGFVKPQRVVDLKGLPGMCEVRPSEGGWLVIGAACTMNQVASHAMIQGSHDLLVQACNSVASYQLRNRATLGGNCCNGSPAADSAPALYCLGAVAEIYGPNGTRRSPISQFLVGPGRTALLTGEFLTAIHLPPPPVGARGSFHKLGRTKLGDLSIVSVAVYAWPVAQNAILRRPSPIGGLHWRIALGAVGPTPLRAVDAESALALNSSTDGVERAAELAAQAARPIDDVRASSTYRRAMVRVLTRRGIEEVLRSLAAAGDAP